MIIASLFENFLLIMIFKISDSFFENNEIIPLAIVPFIAGFAHTFFLPAFVGFFIMSYQYVMYRRVLTNFCAYICTVITHATVNCFAFLAHYILLYY